MYLYCKAMFFIFFIFCNALSMHRSIDPAEYRFSDLGHLIGRRRRWSNCTDQGRTFMQHWYVIKKRFNDQSFENICKHNIGQTISPGCQNDECMDMATHFLTDTHSFISNAKTHIDLYTNAADAYKKCKIFDNCSHNFVMQQESTIKSVILPFYMWQQKREMLYDIENYKQHNY